MTFSVTRQAQSFVQPYQPTPSDTLRLSAIDRVPGLRHMVRSLHVFRQGQSPAKVIREALARALVAYYPFAGRLVDDHESGEVVVACNGEGAWFVEATASCSLEDVEYLDCPLTISEEELLPQAGSEFDPLKVPIMLQVTEFACGGFVVGIVSVHTMADGLGAGQFINAVAEQARGLSSHEPCTARPIWSRDLIPNPPVQRPATPPDLSPLKLRHSTFDLAADYINKIKASYFETTGQRCSAFDISVAKAWQARARAINLDAETPVSVCFFANVRHLLTPDLLPQEGGFYGNFFYPVTATAKSAAVADSDVMDVVSVVRDAKAKLPSEFARWASGEFREDPYQLKCTYDTMFVSDWARLGFMEVDYGWGRPVQVVPFTYHDCMAVVIFGAPRAPKKGVRAMTQCVAEEHLPAFEKEMMDLA